MSSHHLTFPSCSPLQEYKRFLWLFLYTRWCALTITTSLIFAAALRVLPNRSQFFHYESVSLSCELQGNSSDWRVKRNTSTGINEECYTSLNSGNGSICHFTDLYPLDSGVYWCESGKGECSNSISINVTGELNKLPNPLPRPHTHFALICDLFLDIFSGYQNINTGCKCAQNVLWLECD